MNMGLHGLTITPAEGAAGVESRVLALLQQSDAALGGNPEQALAIANEAAATGSGDASLPTPALQARIACQIGTCNIWLGRYADAITALRRAAAQAEIAQADDVLARAINNIGVACMKLGDAVTALDYFDRALILRRALNDRAGQAATLHNIGIQRRELGDLAGAREAYAETLAFDRDTGDRMGEGRTLMSIGVLAYEQKQMDEAASLFRQAVTLAIAAGDHISAARGYENIASVAIADDRITDALADVDRGLDVAKHLSNPEVHADLYATRGKALRVSGQFEAALEAFAVSTDLVKAEQNKRLAIELNREISMTREALGDAAGALQALKRAYELEREVNTEDARRRLEAIAFRQEVERAHSRAARFERLAHEDPLTGLSNRRWLELKLQELGDAAVAGPRPVSVVMLDIDYFKKINDQFSHGVGDDALRGVAKLLREQCREQDVVARYGGEEFSLVLPGISLSPALDIAERIRSSVAHFAWERVHEGLHVTISAGVASSANVGDVASLVARADAALYRAKAAGRNRVCE